MFPTPGRMAPVFSAKSARTIEKHKRKGYNEKNCRNLAGDTARKKGITDMGSMFLDGYIKISIVIALIDAFLAVKSFQKNRTTGRYLGYACAGAAVVDISYLISILFDQYLCMSIMSSIYFVTIDVMLLCLLVFTVYFTKGKFTGWGRRLMKLLSLYAAFEVVVFAINPFWEIAVRYVPRNTAIAKYSYEMRPLYISAPGVHLLPGGCGGVPADSEAVPHPQGIPGAVHLFHSGNSDHRVGERGVPVLAGR